MKIDPVTCPHAERRDGTQIWCRKAGDWCAHVFFKTCKGWWVQSPQADKCPIRSDRRDSEDK